MWLSHSYFVESGHLFSIQSRDNFLFTFFFDVSVCLWMKELNVLFLSCWRSLRGREGQLIEFLLSKGSYVMSYTADSQRTWTDCQEFIHRIFLQYAIVTFLYMPIFYELCLCSKEAPFCYKPYLVATQRFLFCLFFHSKLMRIVIMCFRSYSGITIDSRKTIELGMFK